MSSTANKDQNELLTNNFINSTKGILVTVIDELYIGKQ
jgi:hypothetical protein